MKPETGFSDSLLDTMEQKKKSEKDSCTAKFSMGFYLRTVTRLLSEPKKFFGDCAGETTFNPALCFLVISSLFFTAASLMSNMYIRPFMMGVIFFVNAVSMAFIAAAFGYVVMTMLMGRKVSFVRFFSIYAFASGITLLVSWVPFLMYLTEPWKWWLVGTGMTMGCGFRLSQALVIIGVSMGVMFLFFWSVLPIITPGR